VLPTGKVLMWGGDVGGAGGSSGDIVRLWDPATGTTTAAPGPGYDLFCAGHVFLEDGRLFAAGGHIQYSVGLPDAATYDPFNNLWTGVPDMWAGRWYPTTTVLSNGDVLVISGSIDATQGENTLPSVFQVGSSTWRDLTGAQLYVDLYPRMHLAPDGGVFNSAPSTLSRALDTSGTGAWSDVASHAVDIYRDYASSVMYAPGKILVAGGSDPPSETAEVIDLNQPNPIWRQVSSMAFPRRQLNAAILPDGKVLVTGGTYGAGFSNAQTPVFAAEMWDPATETWTTMASAQLQRLYHSSIVLLPDGRLVTMGGDGVTQVEVYEPPYLFAGTRPTITSAPSSAGHGQSFFVQTPNAGSIAQVTLIALPSVTHAFNMNERFNRLVFSQAGGGLNVVAPPANLAPPGPYMLFILNSSGVPSVARIVSLTSASGSSPTLSSLSPASAAVGGPPFTLTVNGGNFVSGSVVQWNGAARATTFVSSSQLTAAIPASDIASGGEAQVTVTNPGGGASNVLTFGINALTVSPGMVAAGSTATVTWSGLVTPSATDWIGLYAPGTPPNTPSLEWMYVSCSKTPGSPRASGSCPFTIPTSLAPGGYEMKLFADNTYTQLQTSNVFTVSTGVTLAASPVAIPTGGTVTATWNGIVQPTATDWIGLYLPGSPDTSYLEWTYVSCTTTPGSPRASGSCPFTVPASHAPGTYQLRLFADSGLFHLASSNSFSVGASAGALQFSAATYTVSESGGSATITIMRTGGNSGVVGVTVSTSNGTATAGADYTAVSQTVAFANADTANKTISIPINNDTLGEGNETINIVLSNPTGGATLASLSSAVLTITDDDGAAPGTLQFSAASYSVAENGGSATITVTRTGGSAGAVGVTVATSNGTATAGSDYTAVSQTVSFANNDTASKTVSVPIINDTQVESNETVNVALSAPTGGASLGNPAAAVLTINDNDVAPAGTLQFSAATYTVNENGGSATITVTRTGGSAGAVGATVATSNGTATAGSDYTAVSQSVSFANNDTASKTVSVPIINNGAVEPSETVNLVLSNPTGGATVGSPGSAVLTIIDDDSTSPAITVSPTTIARGSSVTATWSGIAAPTTTDWMALYVPGTPHTSYIDWVYVSCTKTQGSASASGSCAFTIPASVAAGTYEIRLFANGQNSLLATSNAFTVTAPGGPTLAVSPTTIARGSSVTATWSGIAAPTTTDWMALYVPGTPHTSYIDWIYVSCTKTQGSASASGSCAFTIPAAVAAGTYEMRLFANGQNSLLATSNAFTVTAPGGPTLAVSPTTIARGNAVTAAWSGIAAPTTTDWMALYVAGADDTAVIDWVYLSCTTVPGAASASGSCAFTIPESVPAGTYEMRLFANGQYSRVATSNVFTVTAPGGPTIAVTPTTIARGSSVTAAWSGIAGPTTTDWMALYVPGTPHTSYIDWIYVSCTKTQGGSALASGSCAFTIPASVAAGTYEIRLFANGQNSLLAGSNLFQVQ
jgi:hypothetical protein